MIVTAAAPEDLKWLESATGCVLTPGAKGIRAQDASGKTRGVIAYDNWTPNSAQCHMAVDSPIVWRSLVLPAFHFPFLQAGRGLLVGVINARNTASLKMVKSLGFIETYRILDGYEAGADMVMVEMRKENCGWLPRTEARAA